MRRVRLTVAVVAAAAAALTACAAPSARPAADGAAGSQGAAALAVAAASSVPASSVTLHGSASAHGRTLTFRGEIGLADPATADVVVSTTGFGPARVVLVGGRAYVQQPQLAALAGKPWVAADLGAAGRATRLGDVLDGLGVDTPSDAAALLVRAADLAVVGTETVDGRATTHYAGTVRPAQLLAGAQLPAAVAARAKALVARLGDTSVRLDLWVGADGRPVRLQCQATTEYGPAAYTVDVDGYDAPVHVVAPPPVSTADVGSLGDLAALGGLRGLLHP